MNEGEVAGKHAKSKRLTCHSLPPLHTDTTERVNTRRVALNLHNKIPLFKNVVAFKRSLKHTISQTKRKKKKSLKRLQIFTGMQREQDAKTQQNT